MPNRQEYWLQLENRVWDVCPWGVDRASGKAMTRTATGAFRPTTGQVLMLRRYESNWTSPVEGLVNPWDLTEPGPGGFPGAVLTAKVADEIVVHFRNMDMRPGIPDAARTHSLHPHGAQRTSLHDGAFPVSPPDPNQGGRRGDRVAPAQSFTYHWTCPQRAAAGAWLLEDRAVQGEEGLTMGAFGVLLIRAPGEQAADGPSQSLRQAGDSTVHFGNLPNPPRRAEYVLVFHELPGVGLCLNGRQALGNTPALVAGEGSRVAMHCLNATRNPLSVHLHGHRWERGDRWVDSELAPVGGAITLSFLSGSAENGGGLGEWLITGRSGEATVSGSLVVTSGGALALHSG